MPSGSASTPSPTADQLLRRLSAGHLAPSFITLNESEQLRTLCAERVRRAQERIADANKRGRKRIALRLQRELIEGLPARLLAARHGRQVINKRRRKRRAAAPVSIDFEFASVWNLSERLKDHGAPSQAIRYPKQKPKGGQRDIYKIVSAFGIAKQRLLVLALQPFASFHPSQYTLRRGRSAACETLLETMNSCYTRNTERGGTPCTCATCNTRFIQFDVDGFYPSISRDCLVENLPAPKVMIRSALLLEGWRIIDRCRALKDRRGPPQGSAASSFVAEMVMANVLWRAVDPLQGFRLLVTYSDNVGGLVSIDRDVAALEDCLRQVFITDPAGPFNITFGRSRSPSETFSFLGYSFARERGMPVRAFLPDFIWEQKETEFMTKIAEARTLEEFIGQATRLYSYCASFSLAQETRSLKNGVLQFMFDEIEYRNNGGSPLP